MRETDLELLITLDDPVEVSEEDTFNHLQVNNLGYWFGQRFSAWRRLDQSADVVDDAYKVTFGQGDWTCTVIPNNGIEVCTVTQRKNGEIVEQKLFLDLAGMQKQIGIM